MKNNLLSEKLIYTGESLTPTHLHLCTYNATEMQESSSDTFQAIKGTLNNDQINWLQIHGMKNNIVKETVFGISQKTVSLIMSF